MKEPKHIILAQLGNIGDVILSLQNFSLLKEKYPGCKLSLLAPSYTLPVASFCPYIDNTIDYTDLLKMNAKEQEQRLKNQKADVFIHLSKNKLLARLVYNARIPHRIGRLMYHPHWFTCNHLIIQNRRHSHLNEIQLNAQMLKPLGINCYRDKKTLIEHVSLTAPALKLPLAINHYRQQYKKNIILHPGSNGHGREWPIDYFIELANQLHEHKIGVFFTGGPNEVVRFKHLQTACPNAFNTIGLLTLPELTAFIHLTDGLVASGTGPLHMAAALNKPTLGLFPPRKSVNTRRWSPPGKKVTTLTHQRHAPCFSCTSSNRCRCMKKIAVSKVKEVLLDW